MWISKKKYKQILMRIETAEKCNESYTRTIEKLTETGCGDLTEIAILRKQLEEAEKRCQYLERIVRSEERIRQDLRKERDYYRIEFQKGEIKWRQECESK